MKATPTGALPFLSKILGLVAAGEQYALTIHSYNQVLFVRKII